MDSYSLIINAEMIRNIMHTDANEALDFLSLKVLVYLIIWGFIPSYILYKIPIKYYSIKKEYIQKLKQIIFLVLIISLNIFFSFKHYSSFAREHKALRYMSNPSYWLYSTAQYIQISLSSQPKQLIAKGRDAHLKKDLHRKNKIIILVLGETARADHFSLNGYQKQSTPKLEKHRLVNFSNFHACGTSTAVSVPCMFSFETHKTYTYTKGLASENVLDVLTHSKNISILWRDNNSNSKGVALRIPYQNYKYNNTNTICVKNGECRDEGMLIGLKEYISHQKNKDILIILHQMGNHGPAYYKRYPKAFEKFTPVCKTNQLEICTKEEINNAYDNAILYTDYFLDKTISLLKTYNSSHQTAMFYMSDHGESLGENGIYLHGLPYFIAPSSQTHIPALLWLNKSFESTLNTQIDTKKRYTHDTLPHTLLGLFDIESNIYDKNLDIFAK
jgi:lipid A ethanolaminephosphotransferase